MCKQFALDLDWDSLVAPFRLNDLRTSGLPLIPTYQLVPKQNIALIAQSKDGGRHLAAAYWSLIPSWSPSLSLPFPSYNARVEGIAKKPSFAQPIKNTRAIIPASGFFENQSRRPFYFHNPDNSPLFMAGLYSWWRPDPKSSWMLTATIITCPAVKEVAEIHDRMPLLMPMSLSDSWLNPLVDGATLLEQATEEGSRISANLRFHEVAKMGVKTSNASKSLIKPLGQGNSLSLF